MQYSLFDIPQQQSLAISGLRGAAPAMVAAIAAQHSPLLLVVADEHQLESLASDLSLFTDLPLLVCPGYDIAPYTPLVPETKTSARRIATLYQMQQMTTGIILCSASTMQRRIIPPNVLNNVAEYLEAGESFDQDALIATLQYLGYEQTDLVQSVGDFSLRGGIIDIWPPPFTTESGISHNTPIRLDFFGDTIESIRIFDAISQRSNKEINDIILLPVTNVLLKNSRKEQRRLRRIFAEQGEKHDWQSTKTARLMEYCDQGFPFAGIEFFLPLFYEETPGSLIDILPEKCRLMLLDPAAISESMQLFSERVAKNFTSMQSDGNPALEPQDLFLDSNQLKKEFLSFPCLQITDFPTQGEKTQSIQSSNHLLLKQEISLKRAKTGLIAPLSQQIEQWRQNGDRVVLCCRSEQHLNNLAELLTPHNHTIKQLDTPINTSLVEKLETKTLYLCATQLSQGFSLVNEKIHFVSESELFGEMRLGKKGRNRQKGEPLRFTELNKGDIVVHVDHGLALYCGMETLDLQGITGDFLLLEYQGGDRLYLPIDRLNCITRYQGITDKIPRLDKLGGSSWHSTTKKIKEEVWTVAQELLDIYAKRELKEGRRFSPPGTLYHELEESFPYDETPGQRAAINDVIDDLTSEQPMDRLICGDVGYGKTEVAIRAAFKVIEDGFQVAILVPTTVLAEQHAKTFRTRLEGFAVEIDCINRFRSTKEQKESVGKLASGETDIIIGTHRLLSKDIAFKQLGLVIIDEEHRFGVAHKENLKKMRAEVDILTLTATPIPRTLQMSLLSIRDLSVISSPPEHRQPVKTFVAPFDELVIKEAIRHELRRGGQVFFVHNRVKSIHRIAEMVQKLAPEARLAVAHGQMNGKQLEEIMVSFACAKVDVLVATTIVESGLDIPAANTIIINRADMLGLAEIYQLRGRVGRSSTQAFAYLLAPSLEHLSKESKSRLRALMDCNQLGGGFKLAMSDLQIRGGGNLLGVSQSGNIAAIGYDLYLDLLQKTVADLKMRQQSGDGLKETIDPEVKLQISAYIPEKYIPAINQRYICYRRIAALTCEDEEQQKELVDELRDRYGTIPAPLLSLLRIIGIKKTLAVLRISKLEQGSDFLAFTFVDDTPVDPQSLLQFLQKYSGSKKRKADKLTPDKRLIHFTPPMTSVEHIFATIIDTLDELQNLVEQK